MASPPKYPHDVVELFLKREASRDYSRALGFDHIALPTLPDASELEHLIETTLFASMEVGEGRPDSIGVVFAESTEAIASGGWALLSLRSPKPLTARELVKLSALCEFQKSFLAIVPRGDVLKIVGVATPPLNPFQMDDLIRVLAPRPGVLLVYRGAREIVRCVRGVIPEPLPSYFQSGAHKEQLALIAQKVLGQQAPRPSLELQGVLRQLVADIYRLGHGGVLAVLGPEEAPEPLLRDALVLDTPLPLGEAIREYVEGLRATVHPLTPQTGPEAGMRWENASRRLDLLRERLVRLTAVEGAVLLNHALEVLAFGVRLHVEHDPSLKVRSMSLNGTLGDKRSLKTRGMRHRAAAAFAQNHPKGLAFVVSRNGDAAVFQSSGNDVVYWPLPEFGGE